MDLVLNRSSSSTQTGVRSSWSRASSAGEILYHLSGAFGKGSKYYGSAALYFIGSVRVTFSTSIAEGENLVYWYGTTSSQPLSYQTFLRTLLTMAQDKLPRYRGLLVYYSGGYCWSLLCFSFGWLDIPLGSRSKGTTIGYGFDSPAALLLNWSLKIASGCTNRAWKGYIDLTSGTVGE